MNIAFVYDRINKFGGAERVLLALHEIWPDAPVYTSVYNPMRASWASVFDVKTSFLQKLPFAISRHEFYPIATPIAFETFDFSSFDLVLSITSAEAKGIITKPNTLHVCYCLTPTRYLWSGYHDYHKEPGAGSFNPMVRFFIKLFSSPLRAWDIIASNRPDKYLAISENVKKRINKYYKKDAEVIYPPVDTDLFCPSKTSQRLKAGNYFLIVSRLVPYKRIDYAISAFNFLGWKLKIVGNGIDEKRLKTMAGSNIEFTGEISDHKLLEYYQSCKALIFPGEEDFGMTSTEAQACGKPVIAFNGGGVRESISLGITGELYESQTEESLIKSLKKFEKNSYSQDSCRKNALRFRKEIFQKKMKKTIETLWKESPNQP